MMGQTDPGGSEVHVDQVQQELSDTPKPVEIKRPVVVPPSDEPKTAAEVNLQREPVTPLASRFLFNRHLAAKSNPNDFTRELWDEVFVAETAELGRQLKMAETQECVEELTAIWKERQDQREAKRREEAEKREEECKQALSPFVTDAGIAWMRTQGFTDPKKSEFNKSLHQVIELAAKGQKLQLATKDVMSRVEFLRKKRTAEFETQKKLEQDAQVRRAKHEEERRKLIDSRKDEIPGDAAIYDEVTDQILCRVCDDPVVPETWNTVEGNRIIRANGCFWVIQNEESLIFEAMQHCATCGPKQQESIRQHYAPLLAATGDNLEERQRLMAERDDLMYGKPYQDAAQQANIRTREHNKELTRKETIAKNVAKAISSLPAPGIRRKK